MDNRFFGIPIIEDRGMVVYHSKQVRRSWRERLWSWPWRPWAAERTERWSVPDQNIYRVGDMMVCHPEIAAQLRAKMDSPADYGPWGKI